MTTTTSDTDPGRDGLVRRAAPGLRASAPLLAVALACAVAAPAGAVTDEEVFRTFRFNFVNPGARSLAMGGAFVGIADDATAARANPAGLTNLIAPEFFLEMRVDQPSSVSITGLVEDPSGLAGGEMVPTTAASDPENELHPSFISWVRPFEHWTLGLSRQELLRARSSVENALTVPGAGVVSRADGRLDALIESYNVTAAFEVGDKVALGATLGWARLDFESRVDNFFDFGGGLVPDYATEIDDSDSDLTWTAGILYRPFNAFHVGAVYVDGPEFELSEQIFDTAPSSIGFRSALFLADFLGNRNASSLIPDGFVANPSMFDDPLAFTTGFTVPDRYGIGVGIRPTPAFTIAIDVVHVEFSDLQDGFVGNVNALTFPGDGFDVDKSVQNLDGSFPADYLTPDARFSFEDDTIYRLGMEYVWIHDEKTPFAVRWGAWSDPNFRLQGDFGSDGVFIAGNDTFPGGEDEIHFTLGFGFVLQDKFQADFAADFSDLGDTYLASFIYHF